MKLYHFTASRFVEEIKKDGLTLGQMPIFTKTKTILMGPCQWLTSDGRFDRQNWATRQLIDYDRTDVRLTVTIPKTARDKLCRAYDLLPHLPEEGRRIITDWEGSENWYLFFGRIPPGWIREIVEKPKEKLAV